MKSCVTISLVEEARGGPFVFWGDLAGSCRKAQELGFDAVEIFAPAPDAFDHDELKQLLDDLDMDLAALGTGAGWVLHKKQLCDPSSVQRREACDFIRSIIDAAAGFGASAIIGSMQGRHGDGVDKATALGYLEEALNYLGEHASQYNVPLIYEPLNRYETNLIHTVEGGVRLLQSLTTDNVRLLADLFHMNIEEADIAQAILDGGDYIGHVHFVDSNRRAAGLGHIDYKPIAAALKEIGYDGYLSAEALALPTSEEAARHTIDAYAKYF